MKCYLCGKDAVGMMRDAYNYHQAISMVALCKKHYKEERSELVKKGRASYEIDEDDK